MNWFKEMWVIGFALFSMFFGAGNIIFPPYLGYTSGTQWFLSFLCYFIADIGLAIVAVYAMLKCGSDIDGITGKLGVLPSKIISLLVILCIGPLIAIPRTAATTFELSVLPLIGNANEMVFSVLFFGLVWQLCLRESSVLDVVGKILTPVLFLSLIVIGAKSFITPLGGIASLHNTAEVVKKGILSGYQTLDVLAALIFGVIILKTLQEKGYEDVAQKKKIVLGASLISGFGLLLVYCGLTHLGATVSQILRPDFTRVGLVVKCVSLLFGKGGMLLLSVMVALACLTTAIGLASSTAAYIEKISNGKLKYKVVVTFVCVFSAIFSTMGVEAIVKYAALVLNLLYAPVLTLIFLNLFVDKITNKNVFKGGALGAFLVCLISLGFAQGLQPLAFVQALPLHSYGLEWIGPAGAGSLIGHFINRS